jgi:hypothetical protein
LNDNAFDIPSYNGSDSHVFSIDVYPDVPQSIQSIQVVQFVHVGVQTGLGIQPLFVGVGLGVGVGVGVTKGGQL